MTKNTEKTGLALGLNKGYVRVLLRYYHCVQEYILG